MITSPVVKKAEQLAAAGIVPARLVQALEPDLAKVEADLRHAPAGATQAETAAAITADINAFAVGASPGPGRGGQRVLHRARRRPAPAHTGLDALEAALSAPGKVLPPSSLYAYAAFGAGCAYVDFTPSTGARLPALAELAARRGTCRMPATTARPARRC